MSDSSGVVITKFFFVKNKFFFCKFQNFFFGHEAELTLISKNVGKCSEKRYFPQLGNLRKLRPVSIDRAGKIMVVVNTKGDVESTKSIVSVAERKVS